MIGPIRLYIKSDQTGGNPHEILQQLNTDLNNFLYSRDKKYIFQFNDKKNQHHAYGSHFLSYGSNTAVFSIIDVTNKFQNIILKLTNEALDDFLTCIEKYNHDKNAYGDNIMSAYLWGILYNKNDEHIANFMIVKEYNIFNESNIKSLKMEQKLNMIYDFTLFLTKLTHKKIYLRDVKMANIGFDVINGIYKIVVIDYDNFTTLDNREIKSLVKNEGIFGIIMSSGTYVPYYLIEHYIRLGMLKKKKYKFNKITDIILTNCKSTIDAKEQTFKYVLQYGSYPNDIAKEIETIYDSHDEINTLSKNLSQKLSELNYSEYQNIIIQLTKEFDKVVSVPLAIIISTLLYDANPIFESIKVNEHSNFKNILTQKSPFEYESSFIEPLYSQSLMENKKDHDIIVQIIKGLLKAKYTDILSYVEVVDLLKNLTYFDKNDKIFDISSESPDIQHTPRMKTPRFLPPLV